MDTPKHSDSQAGRPRETGAVVSAPISPAVRALVGILWALAVLQALVVSFSSTGQPRAIAVLLALATSSAAVTVARERHRVALVGLLTACIVVNFGFHLSGLSAPIPYRLAHVGILAAYGAFGLTALATLVLKVSLARALVVTGALALVVVAFEGFVERAVSQPTQSSVRWTGAMEPHPDLGLVNPPNTVRRTLYPDNPRAYFAENGPSPWKLELHHAGSGAKLELSPERPSLLRISIERATDPTAFNIQLNQQGLDVVASEKYALTFDARADGERSISYGISMAHAPWEGLGYYRNATVGRNWREFSEEFTLPSGDANARLHFDVGASPASVEFGHVRLRRLPSGEVVRPSTTATEFFVSYRFNGLGCRGPDFPIPRPAGRHRILTLGDSYGLGQGVHESDTFGSRLETSLNDSVESSAARGYDVINCGVRGYSFEQQRQHYEITGSRYEPDVVLVSVTPHDEASWRQERARDQPGGLSEALFVTARLIQEARNDAGRSSPFGDVDELVTLAEATRTRGARLAAVSFPRGLSGGQSIDFPSAVSSALERAKVPFLDLGPILLKAQKADALTVHPLDKHPNELAHRIAAVEIERFLRSAGLIGN